MADKLLQPGTKVKYTGADGKEARGVVHGVSTVERPSGLVEAASYQIDTGNDNWVDEVPHNLRDDALNERVQAKIDDGTEVQDALAEVNKEGGLPKSKIVIDRVRQPELVTIPAGFVKAV